jgi:hypothetical protein
VHGLERKLGEAVEIIFLNVDDQAGARARQRYAVGKVPAIILLDRGGQEVYRTEGKLPRVPQIREQLAKLGAEAPGEEDGVARS